MFICSLRHSNPNDALQPKDSAKWVLLNLCIFLWMVGTTFPSSNAVLCLHNVSGGVFQSGAQPRHSQQGRDVPEMGTQSLLRGCCWEKRDLSLRDCSVTFCSTLPTIKPVACCQVKSLPWLSDLIYVSEQRSQWKKMFAVKTILSEIKIVNALSGKSCAALPNKCHFGTKYINKKYMCRQSPDTCFDSVWFCSHVKLLSLHMESHAHFQQVHDDAGDYQNITACTCLSIGLMYF